MHNTEEENERILAMERHQGGEPPKTIYTSLGHSKYWFFKWLKRYDRANPDWFRQQSTRPLTSPYRTPDDMEKIVCLTRQSLYNQATFCGAQAILWQMERAGVVPLPSPSTVKRILKKYELTHQRTGRYEPKGKNYPALAATRPNAVQQFDFVGPCYLQGPWKFYSLHAVDVATARCALEPSGDRQAVFASVWDIWKRLGIPRYAQFDNALEFYGSNQYPRNMGQVIRLCLSYGVQAVFIPMREPWRNGVVEKFNDHWKKMFYSRIPMQNERELQGESREFEVRHNHRWPYTRLNGKSPMEFLEASGTKLKFPSGPRPQKLARPNKGKYHVIRLIRSDRQLDIFGERFTMPARVTYEYVRATVNVAAQRLQVYHDNTQIAEFPYGPH